MSDWVSDDELTSYYDRGFEAGYTAPIPKEPRQQPEKVSEDKIMNEIEYAYECGVVDGQNHLFFQEQPKEVEA